MESLLATQNVPKLIYRLLRGQHFFPEYSLGPLKKTGIRKWVGREMARKRWGGEETCKLFASVEIKSWLWPWLFLCRHGASERNASNWAMQAAPASDQLDCSYHCFAVGSTDATAELQLPPKKRVKMLLLGRFCCVF